MTNLQQYAELKQQKKEIDAKLKELEKTVFTEVMAVDGEKLATPYGTFSIFTKKVYKYSDELLAKELNVKESIKLLKKEEELKGKAVLDQIKSILRYQSK